MAQKIRPYQSPEDQGGVVERNRHQTPSFYSEGDLSECVNLANSVAILIIVPEREECKQRNLGCNPFICMGANPDSNFQRMLILCHLY